MGADRKMQLRRRELIATAAALLVPRRLLAQSPRHVPRIGWLDGGSASLPAHAEAFKAGLREIGWIEGQNVAVEWRYAETKYDKLPELAKELVKLDNVDVIVAVTNPEIRATAQVTSRVPIVMVASTDPVGEGFISSLGQPGGNITGLTSDVSTDIFGKYLEFLKEVVPGLSDVGGIIDPGHPVSQVYSKAAEVAAIKLGLTMHHAEVRAPYDVEKAFAAMSAARVQAVLIYRSVFIFVHLPQIVAAAERHKIPTIYAYKDAVAQGGLISYGSSLDDLFKQAATYVDKILKAAAPADLPVEQPTKFQLFINIGTAKALGLTIPPTLVALADGVIE
jgi:putative tryptophan/tyrosine transport system substrate-binding protein